MNSLKDFILTESNRINHASRYLNFLEKYNAQVFLDMQEQLYNVWSITVDDLIKTYKIDDDAIQRELFRNPKATPELSVTLNSEKLVTARARGTQEVAPSVKIPLVYSVHQRRLLTKRLFEAAEISFKKVASDWKQIFSFEKQGKIQPWFKIMSESDELRFQLASGTGQHEAFKTLYAVRIEYGKTGSKLKDFDRIYLTSLIT